MKRVHPILGKSLRVLAWVGSGIVLFFVLIAGLFHIPFIQNFLTHQATSYISTTTKTRVDIRSIHLSLLGDVVIRDIFLEDLQHDTLLIAKSVKVSLSFRKLIARKAHIKHISLEGVYLGIKRTPSDSLFNFTHLIQALRGPGIPEKEVSSSSSQWTFSIAQVSLKEIQLQFLDDYGGLQVQASLEGLNLKMEALDLEKLIFSVDHLSIENLQADIFLQDSENENDDADEGGLPVVSAHQIQINNSRLTYKDLRNQQSVLAIVQNLEVEDGSVDLRKESVTFREIALSKSEIRYRTREKSNSIDTTLSAPPNEVPENLWKVSVQNIDFSDNVLAYNIDNKPIKGYGFDPNHMEYRDLTFLASHFDYSGATTEVNIQDFKAVDQHGFRVTRFETDFRMVNDSLTAKDLRLVAGHSSLDADLNIIFPSFEFIKDSFPWIFLDMDIRKAKVSNSDIEYFAEDLSKYPFFKDKSNLTEVAGKFSGPINDLSGKGLIVKTGKNTLMRTDFVIKGLPDPKTAYFSFPDLSIVTGERDIDMLLGPVIPESIQLPRHIALQIRFTGRLKSFDAILDLNSSYGPAHADLHIDKMENFSAKLTSLGFDLGNLLRDTGMFGTLAFTSEMHGQGLDIKTIKAKVKAEISQLDLNAYSYHNLIIDGNLTGREFEGKIKLEDENASFDLDGLVNFVPGAERFSIKLDLHGADLQALKMTKEDVRMGLTAVVDFSGSSVKKANGSLSINSMTIAREDNIYTFDTLLLASVNNPGKSEMSISSALIDIRYDGTLSPLDLVPEMRSILNNYFPITGGRVDTMPKMSSRFSFEVQLHNHPILTQVLFPELHEFEPGIIVCRYDSESSKLNLEISAKKIVYGKTEARDISLEVNADLSSLHYQISSTVVSNDQIKLNNFLILGKTSDQTLFTSLSAIDDNLGKKFELHTRLKKEHDFYRLSIEPRDFYLAYNKWDISPDNYIEFGKTGFLIHDFQMHHEASQLEIASVNDRINDDIRIVLKDFVLDDFSRILQKDTNLLKGTVDGNILLKRVNKSYGIIADATIRDLIFRDAAIGNLSIQADNPISKRFDIEMTLSGIENELDIQGYYLPEEGNNFLSIEADIQSLSMKTLEALSMGEISEAAGTLSGNLFVQGNISTPEVTGTLVFKEAQFNPRFLNNKLTLKHETIQFKPDGIYLKGFTILDMDQHTAVIDGSVNMKQFQDIVFALHIKMNDFLLFNTTSRDNKEFYGRMLVDSKIDINGPLTLPIIQAVIRAKNGSSFTFAVPEDKLSTYKGEDVVEFRNRAVQNTILHRDRMPEQLKQEFRGFDLSAIVEIEKSATLRLLMDPTSTDSLVVRGEGALSFSIDRSGKMSLTGAYNLDEGSYLVSLQSLIKKQFDIIPGSTIIWSGDLLDAEISINAQYSVRAAPYDLVAMQMSGLSDSEKGQYKQQYPFLVMLKLRGNILQPVISFSIELPPEDKGILGGAVNQKLSMLNEDPSALNKQVFALLLLGRFTQENPLQTETNATAAFVRASVGKLLSQQLNQLSAKLVSGVDLNFDIQSYDDYQSGQAEGRTEVEIGIRKQLFNDRLSVQLGPTVNIEGESAQQNSTSEITSDIMLEYSLTKDGAFRLKGFRHNQYEGVIEGQLVETGVGLVYVRDFNKWKDFILRKGKNRGVLLSD